MTHTKLLLLLLALPLLAKDVYVDNQKGHDQEGDGSEAAPYATIARGMLALESGDTLHLVPNDTPYNEQIDVRDSRLAGTPEARTVIDGHGAVIDRLTHYEADAWKDEGDGLYSMPLRNNAWFMDGHWQGFDLVFFDGEPGRNYANREEMTPLSYFLFKQRAKLENGEWHPLHNTLFIKLPAGKTPADIVVETSGVRSNVFVAADYVTIRSIVSRNSTADGFSSGGHAKGVVFENCEATRNMDQGISHHGSEVTVRNSWFHGNAGCGIVDVYPDCRVHYESCLIEDDVFRGGVEFHKGVFSMENCIVRNVPAKALGTAKGARVTLRNCIFEAGEHPEATGISVGGEELVMENCTVRGFETGLRIMGQVGTVRVTLRNCEFLECANVYFWRNPYPVGEEGVTFANNLIQRAPATIAGKAYAADQWGELIADMGLETGSIRVHEIPEPVEVVGAKLDPETVGVQRK